MNTECCKCHQSILSEDDLYDKIPGLMCGDCASTYENTLYRLSIAPEVWDAYEYGDDSHRENDGTYIPA